MCCAYSRLPPVLLTARNPTRRMRPLLTQDASRGMGRNMTTARGAANDSAMGGRGMPPDRAALLDRSWTEASELYLQELVPRFLPWMQSGLQSLLRHAADMPVSGPVLVPCCGPGHELPALACVLGPGYEVIGVDLSQGMVKLADMAIQAVEPTGELGSQTTGSLKTSDVGSQTQESGGSNDVLAASVGMAVRASLAAAEAAAAAVAAGSQGFRTSSAPATAGGASAAAAQATAPQALPQQAPPQVVTGAAMRAEVGDAAGGALEARFGGAAAAVFSVFGLQQLGTLAPEALASWVRCLACGGVAVVVLWPQRVEDAGPWAALDKALATYHAAIGKPPPPPGRLGDSRDWESQLLGHALKVEGARLVDDVLVSHTMALPSVDTFWKVMTEGGPWRARRLAMGDTYMAGLYDPHFKAELLRQWQAVQAVQEGRTAVQPQQLAQHAAVPPVGGVSQGSVPGMYFPASDSSRHREGWERNAQTTAGLQTVPGPAAVPSGGDSSGSSDMKHGSWFGLDEVGLMPMTHTPHARLITIVRDGARPEARL